MVGACIRSERVEQIETSFSIVFSDRGVSGDNSSVFCVPFDDLLSGGRLLFTLLCGGVGAIATVGFWNIFLNF